MVFAGLPSRRDAGVTPGTDSRQDHALTGHLLAPGEHLTGTDTAPLLQALTRLRTADTLTPEHPDHVFTPLSLLLDQWEAQEVNTAPFHNGLALVQARYAALGLRQLLPLDRVLVAVRSVRSGARGGFHHPNQGYRHLQMRAVVTAYGDLAAPEPYAGELTLLDLLRSYAHDCLHFGSYRAYRLIDGAPVRGQYGVNFRRADGRSYSAPDRAGARSTRNIGTVMEGACDREARSITRQIAHGHGVLVSGGTDGYAFRDVTGQLDSADVAELAGLPDTGSETRAYLASMGRYESAVNMRYQAFLEEIGGGEAEDLHSVILASMISGDVGALSTWLDQRHGPGTFAALFMSQVYMGQMDLVLAS
ncbi:hypothetical protein ACH4FX_12600 [Streptomyces sp. NPDC018019]|uniref:hypothetical protein n=1 Tax=Streptomyces sp. NPDC018019 TaxID=3365030 RepID=UPI0037B6E231